MWGAIVAASLVLLLLAQAPTSLAFISLYRRLAPPRLRGSCRFEPSCSEYARQAIKEWGVIRGWGLAMARLARCRPPFGGFDAPPHGAYEAQSHGLRQNANGSSTRERSPETPAA